MVIALVVVTLLLAVLAVLSAVMKFRQDEKVVSSIHGTVGVPMKYLPVLAGLEIAGALGIVIGLWFAPLGILAAAGLVAYFIGAVIGHVRVGDSQGVTSPLMPLVLSSAALVLRLLTA